MTSLFAEAGRAALREFLTKPVLCLFDFDGTLAPLVSDPASVSLPHPIQQRLQALQSYAPVGIITGRSLADIRKRLDFEPDYVIGNHGLEGLPGWQFSASVNYAICRQWQNQLLLLDQTLGDPLWVEDKAYSLTVHYRHVADPVLIEQGLLSCFARLVPTPRIIAGKFNVSLLPPNAGDKGQAVQQLLALSSCTGTQHALYVGDDKTDEDVFELHHPDILSVRVGDEMTTAADYVIADHEAMLPLLDVVLEMLAGQISKLPIISGAGQR